METATDRRAGQNVRLHLGWKHALNLPVNYKGFHATNLVHFRNRLLEHDQDRLAFDAILQQRHKKGLVKPAGTPRLDSTHILGLVSRMSRLELTRETIRLFLEVVERLIEKFQEAGADMWDLIRWSKDQPAVKEHEKTQLLQRVFDEPILILRMVRVEELACVLIEKDRRGFLEQDLVLADVLGRFALYPTKRIRCAYLH